MTSLFVRWFFFDNSSLGSIILVSLIINHFNIMGNRSIFFRLFRKTVSVLTMSVFFVTTFLSFAPSTFGATFATANGSNGFPMTPIKATSSGPTSALKFSAQASVAAKVFSGVTVSFSGSGFDTGDLAALAANEDSGVLLYQDNPSAGVVGTMDQLDTFVAVNLPSWTSTNVTLTPSTPVVLSNSAATTFFVAIKTSGTVANNDIIIPTLAIDSVVTDDGNGPSAQFSGNSFRVDTSAPTIASVTGYSGSSSVAVKFSEPVQKNAIDGGSLAVGDSPFTYVDNGLSGQTILSIAHNPGQDVATVTMSANLDDGDVDGSPSTIAAGASKIKDMAGNVMTDTATKNVVAGLSISTGSLPGGLAGTSYNSGSVTAIGGTTPYTWSVAGAPDTELLTALGLSLNSGTGALTGTITAGMSGNFPLNFKVTDSTGGTPQTATKFLSVNVTGSAGQGVPGVTAVNPASGIQNTTVAVTVTGSNTSFTNASTVQFLLNNANDTNMVVSSVVANSATSLTFNVAIAAVATAGARDIKVTTGSQLATMTSGFGVAAASLESGLSLTWPPIAGTNVAMPPSFNAVPSDNASVNSYRITVNTTSDFSGTTLWDYAFPKFVSGNGSHCSATVCNIGYGAGNFRIITQPTPLSPGGTYYWRISTYSQVPLDINTSSSVPLESTSIRGFTTNGSLTDVQPPQIMHRPLFGAKESVALEVIARVSDNIATASTTPALTTKIYYCQGSGCSLAVVDEGTNTNAAGVSLGNGFYKFTIPSGVTGIGAAGTVTKYYLWASDGSNTTRFRQPSELPFSLTAVAAGSLASTITGFAKVDGACPVGVQSATVFVDGFGSNATTDGSCAFTLSNLSTGTHNLVAFKTAYGDSKIDGVPVSTTGLTFNLKAGAAGGASGSATAPRVKFTGPPDGMNMVPGSDSNFKVFVAFDRTMSQSSVTATGNMTINTIDAAGALTDITSRGSWTYYPTNPNTAGIPPENNLAVFSFTAGQNFGDNKSVVVKISSVTDTSGNAIQGNNPDGSASFSFNTGAAATFSGNTIVGGTFGAGQFIPPHVVGSNPPQGMSGAPTNTKYSVNFSDPMADDAGLYLLKDNVKLYTVSAEGVETDVSSAAIDPTSLDTSKKIVTVNLKSSYNSGLFAASTKYRLKILGGAKAASGITIAPPNQSSMVIFSGDFKTGTGADSAAPTILGSYPSDAATSVAVSVGAINVAFSKDMDASTISSSSFYLSVGSSVVNGTVEYRPAERMAYFFPKGALSPMTSYTLTISGDIEAANGTALVATSKTFTTGLADSVSPSVTFVNADDYSVAITFTEPMNAAKSTDTLNWASSVLNPAVIDTALSTAIPSAAQFSYDSISNTLIIKGFTLTIGNTFSVAFDTSGDNKAKDLSGNSISTGTFSAVVKNSALTKGNLAPGTGDVLDMMGAMMPDNFSSSTFGFAPPVDVKPFNMMADKTTIYGIRLPISTQIPASGIVKINFPVGFDVSGAKQDVNSPMKTDLNGPGTGVVRFKCLTSVAGGNTCPAAGGATVTGDTSAGGDSTTRGGSADDGIVVDTAARSVIVYLSAATNVEGHDFLSFDISGIRNAAIPKDFNTSGYTIDIKTMNAAGTSTLESLTSSSFYIQGVTGSTYTLSGTITATGNNQSDTMQVYLMSPTMGAMETTSADFATTTTAAYSFTGLPAGEYWLSTDQSIILDGAEVGSKEFQGRQPVKMFVNDDVDVGGVVDFDMTLSLFNASGTAVNVIVDGPSGELIDVFANSPNGFKSRQFTLDGSAGPESLAMYLTDGQWYVSIGPQMPKGTNAGQPPAPSYLPPRPIQVGISGATVTESSSTANDGNIVFTLTASTKTIKGIVKDANDKIIAGAKVFAYSPTAGSGTGGESAADGTFSLGVINGIYQVGAVVEGMPASKEVSVTVLSDAGTYLVIDGSQTAITPAAALAGGLTLKIANSSSTTISGKVTDGTNVIQGAGVYAYRTDGPGSAGAQTDNSGNYKLYVGNGTWKVGSFVPGYGQVSEITAVVADESVTGQDLSPTASGSTYYAVSGTVMSNGAAVDGASVRIRGNSTFNETKTDASGAYSFNVPSGVGYVINASVNGIESPKVGPFDVSGITTGKNVTIGTLRTITFTFSAAMSEAFVSLCSAGGTCANNKISNATTMTLSVPDGSYSLKLGVPGTNLGSSSASGADGTTYAPTTGILTVDGNEALTVTLPTLRTITGTVTDGSAVVANAWVEMVDATAGIHLGVSADADGAFSVQVPDGTYQINAMKPGYFRAPTALTVNVSTAAQTLTLVASTAVISGSVKVGATAMPNAFVKADRQGGGSTSTQADANGNYTLNVQPGTYRIYAQAEGYAQVAYSLNPVTVTTTATGKDVVLTETVALDAPMSNPFSPSDGLTFDDGNGSKVTMPPNAAGTSSSSGLLQTKQTNNFFDGATSRVVGNAIEINASESDGTPIKNLDSEITVEMTYTKAELAVIASSSDSSINTAAEAMTEKMAYYDETIEDWITVPTTVTFKDSSGNVITDETLIDTAEEYSALVANIVVAGTTDHLSLYAPIIPTDGLAPSTPSGFAAAASSTTAIGLSWTATDGATGYDIYRSSTSGGTFSRLGSEPTVSSGATVTYSDTGLSASTAYYYKISAINAAGESASTSEVTATTNAEAVSTPSGGGGGALPSTSKKKTTTKTDTKTDTTTDTTAPADAGTTTGAPASTSSTTSETVFVDVKGHWAVQYISDLYTKGVVSGKDPTHFDPEMNITRAEFIKMVLNSLGMKIDESITTSTFKDVKKGEWFVPYIALAHSKGIVGGYKDNTFKPNGFVTRAEAVKIILAASGVTITSPKDANFPDVVKGSWYADYVNYAAEKGIVNGYANGKFGPNNKLTRAEAAKIISLLDKNLLSLVNVFFGMID